MKRLTALLLACTFLLAACGSDPQPQQPVTPTVTPMVLKEPVYPEFPPFPEFDGGDLGAYLDAEQAYYEGVTTLRGDGLPAEAARLLGDFAAASTALAIQGQEGKNAVYSPLSLWSALTLLAQCSGGESRQQVLDALGADSVEQLQQLAPQLWRALYTQDGKNALLCANSIWLNRSLDGSYVQETLDILARDYYAGSYCVPMGTPEADNAITDWVSEQTGGLIGGGGAPVVQTQSDTLALLASSLYYKAAWMNEFPTAYTKPRTFTAADGSEYQADFMNTQNRSAFLMREGYQAAALSTHLGEMLFVLPDEGVSPESLLADPDFLPSLSLSSEDAFHGLVKWYVPKFDVESTLELTDTLRSMGITRLLEEETADLSALTSLEAFISGAKQMGRVKVDEQGVEAAAVTIIMAATSAAPAVNPKECIMDLKRPFLFLIRHQGIPLFIGVVNQVA